MEPESGRFQHEAPFCEEPDAEVAAKVADDPGHARENRRVAGEPVPAHDGGVEPRVGLAAFELPLPELGPPLYQTHFQVDDLRALRSAIKESGRIRSGCAAGASTTSCWWRTNWPVTACGTAGAAGS